MTSTATTSRRLLVWTLRIVAIALVGWFVSGSVRGGYEKLSQHDWQVQPVWLVAAGALYALALSCMGWFWQRTLVALGCPTPLLSAMCGYFLGHLGKYVPGKAMSVILRVATVRKWVPSMRIAILSTLLETLTMMAVGALLAAVMSIFVLRLEWMVSLAAVGMAVAAGAPTLPPVARRLAKLGAKRRTDESDAADIATTLQAVDYRLLAKGWLAATLCWVLQALSLWAMLRAIGVENVSPIGDLPRLIAAVGFAVVAGFISQLPAGLGVRDALLMRLLIPICGEANALVAAVLMRLVWLLSEVVVYGILYIGVKTKRNAS